MVGVSPEPPEEGVGEPLLVGEEVGEEEVGEDVVVGWLLRSCLLDLLSCLLCLLRSLRLVVDAVVLLAVLDALEEALW